MWNIEPPQVKTDIFSDKVNEIGSQYEFVKSDTEVQLPVKLISLKMFKGETFPKHRLNVHLSGLNKKVAKYKHIENKGLYRSELMLDDKLYSSTLWNKSKKLSDNASALVYLKAMETFGGAGEND